MVKAVLLLFCTSEFWPGKPHKGSFVSFLVKCVWNVRSKNAKCEIFCSIWALFAKFLPLHKGSFFLPSMTPGWRWVTDWLIGYWWTNWLSDTRGGAVDLWSCFQFNEAGQGFDQLKMLFPGGWGLVFVKYKNRFKLINTQSGPWNTLWCTPP